MDDSSSRHILIIVSLTLGLLIMASVLPWGDLTGNRIKDFNLFGDLLPDKEIAATSTSVIVDPELLSLLDGTDGDEEIREDKSAENPSAADSVAVAVVEQYEEAPRRDGHVLIESYTGQAPLAAFKSALEQAGDRIVRIAVVGDSFIEGDIFTQTLRSLLQERFGGKGVGYINLHSEFPGFRRSIRQSGDNWQVTDIRNMERRDSMRMLSGEYAHPEQGAKAEYRGTAHAESTKSWDKSTLLCIASDTVAIRLTNDSETRETVLCPSSEPQALTLSGTTTKFVVEPLGEGLTALGVFLDSDTGIAVDCMSMRGNSGLGLRMINRQLCRKSAKWVDYDLIILEFGINALTAEQTDYTPYARGMEQSVAAVREAYPNADILIMGIADRGVKIGTSVQSMPTCAAMINSQRELAHRTGTHFFDLRAAQGGEGAVVEWRNRNLVNADYIHLNHKGGDEFAAEFVECLMLSLNE